MTLALPRLFLEMHGDQLFKTYLRYDRTPVVNIIPREPLPPISNRPLSDEEMTVCPIRVRCTNVQGTIHFEAFAESDQKLAAAWAEKHKDTTRERFDWLPFAHDGEEAP